jgi:hypothetical protein
MKDDAAPIHDRVFPLKAKVRRRTNLLARVAVLDFDFPVASPIPVGSSDLEREACTPLHLAGPGIHESDGLRFDDGLLVGQGHGPQLRIFPAVNQGALVLRLLGELEPHRLVRDVGRTRKMNLHFQTPRLVARALRDGRLLPNDTSCRLRRRGQGQDQEPCQEWNESAQEGRATRHKCQRLHETSGNGRYTPQLEFQ